MYGCNVMPFRSTAQSAKTQRRQPGLQPHQERQNARAAAIALSKRMNKNQFSMHDRECLGNLVLICAPTWRVACKHLSFKLNHESRHLACNCEVKIAFGDIRTAVLTCPRVNVAQPFAGISVG